MIAIRLKYMHLKSILQGTLEMKIMILVIEINCFYIPSFM